MTFNYNEDNEFYFKGLIVNKRNFELMFGTASTYKDLINHENCTPAWEGVFNDMKKQGILN